MSIKYVPEGLVKIYIDRVIPKADIITPNLFELELIYGKAITSEADIFAALEHCHSKGNHTVIVSSSRSFDDEDAKSLVLYASSVDIVHVIKIRFNRLAGTFAGTGDAFAAMFLAWYTKLGNLKVCELGVRIGGFLSCGIFQIVWVDIMRSRKFVVYIKAF